MALTFGILATLFTAVAIWLSFLNGHAIEAQAEVLKAKEKQKDSRTSRYNVLEAQIAGYNSEVASKLPEVTSKLNTRDELEGTRRDNEASLAKLNEQIVALEKKRDYYQSIVPDIGEVTRLVENLRSVEKNIAEIKEEISTLEADGERLTAEIAQQEETIAYHQKWRKNHSELIAQEELNGKIHAVYKSWGFVIVNTGDIGGVTPNSKLLVKRGEDLICELIVKTPTNTNASAEILLDTMKEGDFVQVGDVVVAKPKEVVVDPAANKKAKPTPDGGDAFTDEVEADPFSPQPAAQPASSEDPFQ